MNPLIKYWHLSQREKILIAEAVLLLALSHLSVKIIPFRYIDRFLRAYYKRPHADNCSDDTFDWSAHASLIKRSLSRAANQLPWQSLCLGRSIAAFIMLRRRDIPVVMFVGVKFLEDASLRAHAWVRTGQAEFTENCGDETFTTLVTIG
jgi:hypothetical protein